MPRHAAAAVRRLALRSRAYSQLTGRAGSAAAPGDALAALGVLHELASSPATAADALALLHELQVHQVELELQDEELRASLADMELALGRRTQLYDHAPVACYALDGQTVLSELNLAGARLLGLDREALRGRALAGFLAAESNEALRALLARSGPGPGGGACMLQLTSADGRPHAVHASAAADPAGGGWLVTFTDLGPA
jgi:PAS domain S-box-containing protein